MYCRDCARYDPENRKCKDAKVNPQGWETAVEVSNVLGLRAICVFNDHREKLIKARTSGLPKKKPDPVATAESLAVLDQVREQ